MLNNPTAQLKTSHLWGFEVSHILFSFGLMVISNFLLSVFKLPVVASWMLGLGSLGVLRLASIGRKAGHLGFVAQFLTQPRVYLGSTSIQTKGLS